MTAMPDNNRGRLLHRANECVNHERNASYGDPRQDFKRTANFWQIYLNGTIEARGAFILYPHDVAILIDLLKTSRLVWTPTSEDNWVDKAGYSACGYDCVMEGLDSTLPAVPDEWQPVKPSGAKPQPPQPGDFIPGDVTPPRQYITVKEMMSKLNGEHSVHGAEDGLSSYSESADAGEWPDANPTKAHAEFLSKITPHTHEYIGGDPFSPHSWRKL